MHPTKLAPALATALLLGCGGAAQSVTAPSGGAPPPAGAIVAAPAAPAALSGIDPEARIVLRVGFARLRETPLFRALMQLAAASGAGMDDELKDVERRCGFPVLDAISEVAVSVTDGADDVVIAARLSVPPENGLACVRTLAGGTDGQLDDGTKAVRLKADGYALVKDGVLYVGTPGGLRRATGPAAGKSALAAKVTLENDTVAATQSDMKDGPLNGFGGTLRASDKEFWLDLGVDMGSDEMAAQMANMMQGTLKGSAVSPKSEVSGLARAVEADGKTLRLHLGKKGSAEEQAQFVGVLGSLAVAGVRKYVAQAKTAEATSTLGEIAKDLSASVDRDRSARKPARFPLSAGPVPQSVPRGTKYRSSPSDWSATWKDIGFSMNGPQYFRYSIVTAPDRKHATVRAEGDFDGDGRSSVYEVRLEIDKNGAVSEGPMQVVDEP